MKDFNQLVAEVITGAEADYCGDITAAWEIVRKLAPLAGDFAKGDGFFILQYGESAEHGDARHAGCWPGAIEEDEESGKDLAPWSAHFHVGVMGELEEGDYPLGWTHGKRFCARGKTAQIAIVRAALIAYGIEIPAVSSQSDKEKKSTVSDLIAQLQQMPPAAAVDILDANEYLPLSSVIIRPEVGRVCLISSEVPKEK